MYCVCASSTAKPPSAKIAVHCCSDLMFSFPNGTVFYKRLSYISILRLNPLCFKSFRF